MMLYNLTYPRREFDENNLKKDLIHTLIVKHHGIIADKMFSNKRYYDGEHEIKNKERKKDGPNARVVCNHAKDISDTASGYFMGNPITYNCAGDETEGLDILTTCFDSAQADDADSDHALNISIYGVSYEYIYAKEDEAELTIRVLEPEFTFIVYDDTIEQRELFAVYYRVEKNDENGDIRYAATVLTENYKYEFTLHGNKTSESDSAEGPEAHYMGCIPVVEYKNNKDNIGDFEQQISLIDAYNTLMSDRVNDKEQFIDAILVIYGTLLGDTEEETGEAMEHLRERKILEIPVGSKAEYLTRTFDEVSVETLRKAIKEDIYTFSHVPNLTDENFAGNSSGVAMEFKLLGLEMITKVKERYYKKGLRKRMRIFCNFLGLKQISISPNSIMPVFSRSLPKNLAELAQIVSNLKGNVSMKTLLQLLPFVESPEDELESVKAENQENIENQKKLFGNEPNLPPDYEDDKRKGDVNE